MPELVIDLRKIEDNARLISTRAKEQGIEIFGVGKGMAGPREVAEAILRGGAAGIGDSRLENLRAIGGGSNKTPLMLLRLPELSRVQEVVSLADISLNSEKATCEALSRAAVARGCTHKVLLMVDLGDLREGVWPSDLMTLVRDVKELPNLEIYGVGTNLTCYGGVMPDEENLGRLVELSQDVAEYLGRPIIVSGGNSSSIDLLFRGSIPAGVNNLRVGEGILLGREAIRRDPVPGAHIDTCFLRAEVIELKEKPSLPIGTVGLDAFGHTPHFEDRGIRRRAILAVGRQDVDVGRLVPRQAGVIILGASGDHLVLDVGDASEMRVGDVLEFDMDYAGMLSASTSPYVRKVYIR
jgi:predicted amino acid racemase